MAALFGFSAYLLYCVCDFAEATYDFAIVLTLMRIETGRTVFDSVFIPDEIAAAPVPQCIERAVAEETIEIISVCSLMTGKVFTFFVTKIGVFFSHPVLVQCFVFLRVTFRIVMRSMR